MFHPFVFRAKIPEGAASIRVVYLDNDRVEVEARDEKELLVARIAFDYCDADMEWHPCPTYPWCPEVSCSLD